MEKLDLELMILLIRLRTFKENPDDSNNFIDVNLKINISLEHTGIPDELKSVGFEVESTIANIAFGTISLNNLEALAAHSNVVSLEKQHNPEITLKDSVPDIRANSVWSRNGNQFSGYTGTGTLIGIIDTGVHFRHESLKHFNGAARVFKIWDQTLTAQGSENAPGAIVAPSDASLLTPLGYGVEYDRNDINATIGFGTNPPSFNIVRHLDTDGHGTHVAGIAAGNGSQAGTTEDTCEGDFTYIGTAPSAELIVVRLWGLTDGDRGTAAAPIPPPSSSSLMIDALKYIIDQANKEGKPVAINCSIGVFTERMDGSGNINTGVNTLLQQNSQGNSIIFAAGNEANDRLRAMGQVPIAQASPLVFNINVNTNDSNTRAIIITYTGSNLQVQVNSPIGQVSWVSSSGTGSSTTANGANGRIDVINNANNIRIIITPPPSTGTGASTVVGTNRAGTWQISLRNNGGANITTVNAISVRGGSNKPTFVNNLTTNSTLSEYASGAECVSVGAYRVGGALAAFSGRGPTTDTPPRTKPEICAPGVKINSAGIPKDLENDSCPSCCCDCCEAFYVPLDGTSMAAPHITGIISLMYHKNPNLTHIQVRDFLTNNAAPPPSGTPPGDIVGWGSGKADSSATMTAVAEVNPPVAAFAVSPMLAKRPSLFEQFLATKYGESYYQLSQKYVQNIMELINTNKRVATVWHRCRGPVWTRLALKALYYPQEVVPTEVHGRHLRDCLKDFANILRKSASEEMLMDINSLELILEKVIRDNTSLSDWLEFLGKHEMKYSYQL